jgi:hypothetical protein
MTVGRYVRIGRATRVGEQAGVVGLRRRGGIESKPVSEPGRNQGAAQAVLERLAHAQVGGHAQRGDELRASNLLVALRRFG